MRDVHRALQPLDAETRKRVVEWVETRLANEKGETVQPSLPMTSGRGEKDPLD